MDYFSKNKILGWIIIIGLAINIAAITTILYKVYKYKEEPANRYPFHKNPHEFISSELNLSQDQEKKFKEIKKASGEEARELFMKMREQRRNLLNVLVEKNPDTVLINQYVSEIQNSQALILHHTINHYFRLKKVLKEEQYPKLNLLYMDMFGCDRELMGKGFREGCGKENDDNKNNTGGKRHRHGQKKNCNNEF